MAGDVRITWDDKEFKAQIAQALKIIKDNSNLLNNIGIQATSGIEKNFDKEEDSNQAKWARLSDRTVDARRKGKKKNNSVKILRDTGALSRITHKVETDKVLVGTTVDYGGYHQMGTKKIPKREWLYISEESNRRIKLTVEAELKKIKFDKQDVA